MIKKLVLAVVLLFSISTFSFSQDMDVKNCDIIVWRPQAFLLVPDVYIPSIIPEFMCDNIDKLWYHVDLVIDKDGLLMTSTPKHGAGATSTIDSRLSGTWISFMILRNDTADCNEVLDRAYSLEGAYDWTGYYLHVLDLCFSCSKLTFFRDLPREIFEYHCASFVFTATEIVDNPNVATPFDVVNDIKNGTITDWKIVQETDLE